MQGKSGEGQIRFRTCNEGFSKVFVLPHNAGNTPKVIRMRVANVDTTVCNKVGHGRSLLCFAAWMTSPNQPK